ncbi:probable E3 ubiquitin-protein ligase RHY1A, partial [Tanacetum coccineum]
INVEAEIAKKDLQTKLDNHLAKTEKWTSSSQLQYLPSQQQFKDDDDDVEEKRVNTRWTSDEEISLTESWVEYSQNTNIGKDQSDDVFWNLIMQYFNTRTKSAPRTKHMMAGKWSRINGDCQRFNAIYKHLTRKSGEMRLIISRMQMTLIWSDMEHEASVHLERGHSQSPSGTTINSDGFRSIHRRRAAASGSDRLPGSVLLARERLVERLRGVSVSGNRQSSRSPSNTHQDDFYSRVNNSFVGTNSNLLETRNERLIETTRKNPPGLTRDALNSLQLEVFSNENDEKTSRECTICLESFQDGDKLIRLRCGHEFHSCCIFPWVRITGESRKKEEYLCFPEHYCACYSFFYDIVNRGEQLCCKHQLAARLAVSLGTCVDVKVSDEQLAELLAKL